MDPVKDRWFATLMRRHLTPAGNYPAKAVTAAATTLTVTFARAEQDTAYGVAALPNWLSTVAVTTKTKTGCTITFGTGAPANATCDICIFRSE